MANRLRRRCREADSLIFDVGTCHDAKDIEVPKAVLDRLAEIGARHNLSRAEVIRRALLEYLEKHLPAGKDDAFGLWKKRPTEGIAYENDLRDDWRR